MKNVSYNLADEIEERLLDFAVRIIKLIQALPRDPVGGHIADQLLRCGTSPAPNYAEARGAESRADFAHKFGIVRKELNESNVWLRMIERAELLSEQRLRPIRIEATELSKIVQASVNTLREKK